MFGKFKQNSFGEKLKGLMIALNAKGSKSEELQETRRLALSIAKIARTPGKLKDAIKGIGDAQAFHDQETASWISAEAIAEGQSGPFEACNLLAWIEIAKKAGVAHIPAKVILHLTDRETEMLSGMADIPTGKIPDRIRNRVREGIAKDKELQAMANEGSILEEEAVDMEMLVEKLFACMDDVPEGYMVRTNQSGPSTLKALAGTGIIEKTAPEVRFGSDLEIGPGWIRNGNRRRVDNRDRRLMKSYVAGPHTGMIFVARPWVEASRYIAGRDPHRAGTPLDAEGKWPAEWRAFVKNGKVVGVSSYYAWVEEPTPETARIACEVRDLAQKMVDAAIAQKLEPRYADVEHARRNPEVEQMLEDKGFGRGTFSCTIDFIETKNGIMMLEAGPGHTPVGGGHACGFAGVSGKPLYGNAMDTTGVAFRHMPHVLIGEPATWTEGDKTGCILDWDEVEKLANN